MQKKYLELIDKNNRPTYIAIDSITAIVDSKDRPGTNIFFGNHMLEIKKPYLQIIKQLTDIQEFELVKFD